MSEQQINKLEELEAKLKDMDNVQPLDTASMAQETAPEAPGNEAPAEQDDQNSQPQDTAAEESVAEPATTQPETEPEAEDDPADLLELDVQNPQAEHFRKLREVAKSFKQQTQELQRQLEQIKQQPSAPQPQAAAAPEPQQPAKPQLTPDQVMEIVAKARNNEYANVDQNRVVQDALVVMREEFSPLEIRQIMDKANRGEYGKYSEDIQLFMQEAVPQLVVHQQARDMETKQEQAQREEAMQQYRQKAESSMERMYVQHPQLRDEKSALRQAVNKFLAENIGEIDPSGQISKPGPLAPLLSDPAWPEKLVPMALRFHTAQSTRVVSAPYAETSGSRGGPQAGTPQPGKGKLEQLEEQLRSMGPLTT